MNLRSFTKMFAALGAFANFVCVFFAADPGALQGTGILLGFFLGAICAAPFLFGWIFPVTQKPNGISSLIMLIAVIGALGFSALGFWMFMTAEGAARDPFILVAIPIYLSAGLGISAAITQYLSKY